MSKQAVSAKGELVDFSVLQIKQQLSNIPAGLQVSERQNYIDEKFGRNFEEPALVIDTPKMVQQAENTATDWNALANQTDEEESARLAVLAAKKNKK